MAGYYDKYNEIAEFGPIIEQHGTLYITGYAEAKQILGDSKRFVKNIQNSRPVEQRIHAQPGNDIFSLLYNNMLGTDPPDHTRLRKLVGRAFTNREVHALEPRIQEIADQLIDQFEDEKQVDLVEAYSFQLPIIVICELLGVPVEDRHLFRDWSHAFIGISNNQLDYIQSMQDFVRYIGKMIADRRANPQDDLISGLVYAEEEGERLTEQELYSMIALLIVAGHETTVSLISTSVSSLLQNPEQMGLLQEDPEKIKNAIEEFLRFEGPVEMATARYAAEDVQVGETLVRRGTPLVIILGAANRDPAAFEEPIKLDVTRDAHQHLSFGYGIHFCVGAPLARLEARIAVETLLRRLQNIQLNIHPSRLQYNQGAIITGLVSLPIRWE